MKRELTPARQGKIDDGQMYQGFDFKGKHHRPLTGGALKFLQRINSPLYTTEYENYSPIDIIVEYLYATSATPQELAYASTNWETVQFEFADNYSLQELSDPIIAASISRDLNNQEAASFEVKDNNEKKLETVPIG